MNDIYLKSIHVNRLHHLQDFDICVCDTETGFKHLMLTGPNGTGKTLLLTALMKHLEKISRDTYLNFLKYKDFITSSQKQLEQAQASGNAQGTITAQNSVEHWQKAFDDLHGEVEASVSGIEKLPSAIASKKFIIAYYGDRRRSEFKEVRNPEKPDLEYKDIRTNKVSEFIKFLVHLKVQRALAEGENAKSDAQEIEKWFDNLESILRRIFEDEGLRLEFEYKTYSFYIHSLGKKFKFTELSAGYSAALDIVADLILKMQEKDRLTGTFDIPGIVMIDEIETHLHLKMQREILPLLTTLFPNIQLIVTTHSPFVLSSLENAVAYDLEHREEISDLTSYSYDALAEGYFGVEAGSSKLYRDIARLEALSAQNDLSVNEKDELKKLFADFKSIPDTIAPIVKGRYYAAVARMPHDLLERL